MDWNEEEKTTKKGMELSSKILLGIIICIIFIIILIGILLLNIQTTSFKFAIDGVNKSMPSNLLATIDGTTYINIEEFSKLVNYEFHDGEEYKAFTKEKDKCFVKGEEETATFYLNDSKVLKLPVDELTEDYREFSTEKTIKEIGGKMYAPIDAIQVAFNVLVYNEEKSLTIYTLPYLVTQFDTKVVNWGYTGISDQDFENQKSLLYGYLIVKKENGLYKIIDTDNTKEIVSDKYNAIEFTENTQEFFVTNSLGQVGIINLDGTTKIEPAYDSIKVLDKKEGLYLVSKNSKYGVVKSGNITIIYPEYDRIGLDTKNIETNGSQYLILDTLIPVYKNQKCGAFDKEGNLVIKLDYDDFGCDLTTVEVNSLKKAVQPVIAIEECDGVVVKKDNKYILKNLEGKDLVSTPVDSIYCTPSTTDEDTVNYYILYNGKELNVIDELVKAGIIEKKEKTTKQETEDADNTTTNTTTGDVNNTATENVENNVTTTDATANTQTSSQATNTSTSNLM